MRVHQYTHLCPGETVRARSESDGDVRITVYDVDGDAVQYLLMSGEQARQLLRDLRDTPRVATVPPPSGATVATDVPRVAPTGAS